MLREMVDLTEDFKKSLEDEDLNSLGRLLNYNWELKKQLASNISNNNIDLMYQEALRKGAVGGKLLGAGGAGFLMIMAFDHKPIEDVLNCKSIGLKIDQSGTRIINSEDGAI
jgi:D-glycero-alpha-D-manno-heptose-7-phosphate kinase